MTFTFFHVEKVIVLFARLFSKECISSIWWWIMNCFGSVVNQWKAFSLISSQDRCQRFSPSRISDTLGTRFEPAQNLSSAFVEWSCAVVITTTSRRHIPQQMRQDLTLLALISMKSFDDSRTILPLMRCSINDELDGPMQQNEEN